MAVHKNQNLVVNNLLELKKIENRAGRYGSANIVDSAISVIRLYEAKEERDSASMARIEKRLAEFSEEIGFTFNKDET